MVELDSGLVLPVQAEAGQIPVGGVALEDLRRAVECQQAEQQAGYFAALGCPSWRAWYGSEAIYSYAMAAAEELARQRRTSDYAKISGTANRRSRRSPK